MTMNIMLDLSKEGLEIVHKPWEIKALQALWGSAEGLSSREVHEYVLNNLEGTISRAAIILFLDRMTEQDILDKELESCKGGYRGIYSPKINDAEYEALVVVTAMKKLLEAFPQTVENVLRVIQ